jgi:hypothetical protein
LQRQIIENSVATVPPSFLFQSTVARRFFRGFGLEIGHDRT